MGVFLKKENNNQWLIYFVREKFMGMEIAHFLARVF
jgi:hypothetical protein